MTPTPYRTMPTCFAAGTTLQLLWSHPSYPTSEGWDASLHIAGAKTASVVGEIQGNEYFLEVPESTTAELEAGLYQWAIRVENETGIFEADRGFVTVLGDIADATDGEFQDWAEKTLKVLDQAIAGRLPSGLDSYQILGRAVSKIPLSELFAIRKQLNATVNAKGPGRKISRSVLVSFTGTGFDR